MIAMPALTAYKPLMEEIKEKRKMLLKLISTMEYCVEQIRDDDSARLRPSYVGDGDCHAVVSDSFTEEGARRDNIASNSYELVDHLQSDLEAAIPELEKLKQNLERLPRPPAKSLPGQVSKVSTGEPRRQHKKWPLLADEYKRYARQLILPEVQLEGQIRLKSASVLVIGVGGLGCPAAAYLAGAGVGHIGLVDGDVVEASNLHRQILHSTRKVGMSKVDSAIDYLKDLNPLVNLTAHHDAISSQTALPLLSNYDLVLDCTDNPATRYLISDACILLQKILVSASALRTDGQLMILNNPPSPAGQVEGGPCYRCIFPRPPPAETVITCGEGGILGPVVGVMGVLQALEAIKIITAGQLSRHSKSANAETKSSSPSTTSPLIPLSPALLIFSATSQPPFRHIRLRPRRANCVSCSTTATITADSLNSGSLDYVQFCGAVAPANVLSPQERLSAADYVHQYMQPAGEQGNSADPSIVIDVRPAPHFSIFSLPKSVNVPFTDLSRWTMTSGVPEVIRSKIGLRSGEESEMRDKVSIPRAIHIICARGNDSQYAVQKLKSLGLDAHGSRFIGDIEGGWHALKKEHVVDGEDQWPDI